MAATRTVKGRPAPAANTAAGAQAVVIGAELKQILRIHKPARMLTTLPDRLALARQQQMTHVDFLELALADEITRRETNSAALRSRAAGLDPAMRLDTWEESAAVRYDRQLWNELVSPRFLDGPHGAVVLGPVGVGKTHLASALGHIAVRRRRTVHMSRADKLFKRLKAARLDNTPRRRDPPPGRHRTAPHGRLRTQAAGRHRDHRLVRTHRRAAPKGIDGGDQQQGAE
ncbi:MAG TPA: ATP-binding protein [Streptosporangiaceae bacterium]|nr:ATP-binding protein [Streptosporangiaceae bacterium]